MINLGPIELALGCGAAILLLGIVFGLVVFVLRSRRVR